MNIPIKLEEIKIRESKSRDISLFVITTLLIFTFTNIGMVFPLPIGIVMLYIFKDLGTISAKALMMSDVMHIFYLVMFFNILFFINCLLMLLTDISFVLVYLNGNNNFSDWQIFKMGFISSIIWVSMLIVPVWNMMAFIEIYAPSNLAIILSILGTIAVVGGIMGSSYVIGFKGLRNMLKNLFKVEKIRLI